MKKCFVVQRTDGTWEGIVAEDGRSDMSGVWFTGEYRGLGKGSPILACYAPGQWAFWRELREDEQWPDGTTVIYREGQSVVEKIRDVLESEDTP